MIRIRSLKEQCGHCDYAVVNARASSMLSSMRLLLNLDPLMRWTQLFSSSRVASLPSLLQTKHEVVSSSRSRGDLEQN